MADKPRYTDEDGAIVTTPAAVPLVSVVIATRNRIDELRQNLRSLAQQMSVSLELIVIDDASDVDIGPAVRKMWPGAIVSRNESNRGYIASRSTGLKKATGHFIVSLDDDASLTDPRDLANAVERMVRDPHLGLLTFFVHNGPDLRGLAGARPQERYVHTFIGCGHMIRKEVVETLGGYRDFYFYYAEEAEYSLRVLDAGWRIRFYPSVLVSHRVSPLGRSDSRVWAYSLRNGLWTILLHMPGKRIPIEIGWKLFVNALELLRRWEVRWGMWALVSFVQGLPRVLRLRKPISDTTLKRYDELRFRVVVTDEEYETAGRPSLGEVWRWFRSTWWHRRRGRPLWDRRAGAIGQSSVATFVDHRQQRDP